jgi:hypothetical protein
MVRDAPRLATVMSAAEHRPTAMAIKEKTSRMIDREFPYQIEIMIPEGGLSFALEAVHAFCRALDYKTRDVGRLRRIELGDDAMRWCFRQLRMPQRFRRAMAARNCRP